ncbi:hypothetical protein B0H19DRAFT_1257438 [Mycena capillaripes]|nr:hypothetical protein B0H19DRAFT_1257438 [Mycena capillaripes]
MLPHINDPTFTCPKPDCQRILQLKRAWSGQNAKRYYVACLIGEHVDCKNYWHFFPLGVAPGPATTATPSLRLSTSSSSSSLSSTSAICVRRSCNKRFNKLCNNQMCRLHCLDHPAACRKHRPDPNPAAEQPLPPPLSDNFLQFLNTLCMQFDNTPSSTQSPNRPSSLHVSSQEDADFQYALSLSLESSPPTAPHLSSPKAGPSSSQTARATLPFDTTHRFDLVYSPTNGAADIIAIDSYPTWPRHWPQSRLSDIPELLITTTKSSCDDIYECYSTKYGSWMKIPINYVHRVATDQSLLVRRVGIVGVDEEHHIRRLKRSSSPSATIPLPSKKRRRSHDTGKGKSRVIEIDSSEDDDIEFVRFGPQIKIEPQTPRATKRLRPTITIPSTPTTSMPSSSSFSDTPPPTTPDDDFPFTLPLAKYA